MNEKFFRDRTISECSPELTAQDLEERAEFKKVLAIMEKQRVIGITRAQQYNEAIHTHQAINGENNREKAAEGDITELADMVIFDWDGVLLNSMDRINTGAIDVIRLMGDKNLPYHTDEAIRNGQEAPYYDMYAGFNIPAATKEEREALFKLYHDEIRPKLKQIYGDEDELFPDVIEALHTLVKQGLEKNPDFKIGIISADNTDRILKKLQKEKLDHLITFISGENHSKTKIIQQTCDTYGVDVNRVLYVGDLPSDIRDATAASPNIKTVAMARFPEAKERLTHYLPDYVVTGLSDDFFHLTPCELPNNNKDIG